MHGQKSIRRQNVKSGELCGQVDYGAAGREHHKVKITQIQVFPGLRNTYHFQSGYYYVLALGILYSSLYIGIMLVVDLVYGVLDPRIRVAKKGGEG